ncbi:MAG: hypothetical protein PWP04_223 [Candidatus Atribacteria bacterium]|nr:hypothetical protein [Candidatus Atribacteria bacterium]
MITAGIDVGSQSTGVVIQKDGQILSFALCLTGIDPRKRAKESLKEALEKASLSPEKLDCRIATGYSRHQVEADRTVSEISAQAKGAAFLFPKARGLIDIGGQDTKVVLLSSGGKVVDFLMNDKCAAGTGRFLELMAQVLEISLTDFGKLVAQAQREVELSSTCAVFAQSELVGLIAQGKKKEDLSRAVCQAVVDQVANMVERIGLVPPVVFTGGVAKNQGVASLLEKRLGFSLLIPPEPQITAALGASLVL